MRAFDPTTCVKACERTIKLSKSGWLVGIAVCMCLTRLPALLCTLRGSCLRRGRAQARGCEGAACCLQVSTLDTPSCLPTRAQGRPIRQHHIVFEPQTLQAHPLVPTSDGSCSGILVDSDRQPKALTPGQILYQCQGVSWSAIGLLQH